MIKNLFYIGQRVVVNKGKVNAKIFQIDGMYIDIDKQTICYHSHNDHSYTESELELVKEKRKVTLWAPIYQNEGHENYFNNGFYRNTKAAFNESNIVGWHSIEIEIDE